MACPDFEQLVQEGPNGHAARCETCAALLDALREVDSGLETAYAGIHAPPSLAAGVRLKIAGEGPRRGLSLLPEVLDLIGWLAILGLVAVLVPQLVPPWGAALAGL